MDSRAAARDPASARGVAVAAWCAVFAWMAVIWWLGSGDFGAAGTSRYLEPLLQWLFPNASADDRLAWAEAIRNLAHPAVYGALAGLVYFAARVSRPRAPKRAAAFALMLAIALAVLDETRQAQLATRVGSPADVGLDAAGALGAVVMALALTRRRERRASLSPPIATPSPQPPA